MRVKLLRMTEEPTSVMWTAARTCYSEKSPIEIWEDGKSVDKEKKWNLVKKILDSKHYSIAEHVYFTFAIEGISRSCANQLTRHRIAVFSQKSQRYVEIKEDYKLLENDGTTINETNYLERADLINILDKYFIWDHNSYPQFHVLLQSLYCYLYQVQKMGVKPEDARQVLPNATKTDLTMSVNLRELAHMSNLRLCCRSQAGIRKLFQEIKREVEKYEPLLATLLVPSCEVRGFCEEAKSCGRKPKLSEIKENK